MGAPNPVELIKWVGAPNWELWGVGAPKSGEPLRGWSSQNR
jgi:hypothetical protein